MKKIILSLIVMLIAVYSAKAVDLTYTVFVPPGTTNTCYIVGKMTNNWNTFVAMTPDNPSNPTKFTTTISADPSDGYKYCCGQHWDFVEKDEWGGEIADRSYSSIDYVATWKTGASPLLPAGINIINNSTVSFILHTPVPKSSVYLVGDFNGWLTGNSNFSMKRYGEYWWLTVTGLDTYTEYAFQYLVDGNLYVSDPYAQKVLDPWNDQYIPDATYPDALKEYPTAIQATPPNVHGMVSVFQIKEETPYEWKVTDFVPPRQDKLVIYELWIRDFTEDGDLNGVMSKLDYLQGLGINAIELMPVQEFDGNISWGYNPCYYFAMDKAYGTKDKYKAFIDECHRRGIAVILDVVYNHATGAHPFAKLYWDAVNNRTASNNPWFNEFARHPYNVFHQFKHETTYVRNFVKRNLKFLLEEYKIDGFRFDLTKGFSSTYKADDNAASRWDIDRINYLKEYYDQIKSVNNKACMIIEHFCDFWEEEELSKYGLMPWGRKNNAYCQAAMGWQSNSDFNGINGWTNSFTKDYLVGFMESHDEERIMYKAKTWGAGNIQGDAPSNVAIQMERAALCAAFFLPFPGPKMIWQFGELGYDYSIHSKAGVPGVCNYNDNLAPNYDENCNRTEQKEIRWDYFDDPSRRALYDTYAKLIKLRDIYGDIAFDTADDAFDHPTWWDNSWIGSDDWPTRLISLNSPKVKMAIIGNFHPSASAIADPSFPEPGIWYDYMTGEERTVVGGSGNDLTTLAPHEFKIYIYKGAEFIWSTTAANTNWNSPANWSGGEVPNKASSVTIPGGANNFPVLNTPVEVNQIHFKPGAQIGNQSKLTGKAFVQYDLHERECWHMLSIPLGQVYPADFSFGGYPLTRVRTFTTAKAGSAFIGSWVTAKNNSRGAFSFGDGFVLRLGQDVLASVKGLQLLPDQFRELPYFHHHAAGSTTKTLYEDINPAHDYGTIASGESTFYDFELNSLGNNYVRKSDNYQAPRDNSAYNLVKNEPFTKSSEFTDGFALIGNPYMAALNFNALYAANNSIIAPNFYIWEKSKEGYTVYSSAAGESVGLEPVEAESTSDNLIAPLQGFIIEHLDRSDGPFSLAFRESMTTVDKNIQLRSSVSNENKLRILARNPVAGVRALIAKKEGGQTEFGALDARKIMNGISEVPEIYTLKPSNNKSMATSVNIVDTDDLLIPIGLATSYKGDITLSFSGMDSYDATLTLIDAAANKEVNLTSLTSCDYVFNYTPAIINGKPEVCENRFFIRISKVSTGISEIIAGKANVFESNGLIRIVSSASNPLKEVAVYDLQGALVYKKTALDAISHTLNLKRPAGVYVVKVISEKNTDTVKLIMR